MEVKLGYKQTEVGVLPEEWNVRAFGTSYAEPSRNGIYKSAEYQGRGTRMVNMGELFGFDFLSNQEMSRVMLTSRELATSGLREGDLLFGRRSVVPAGAGKCSIVVDPVEPMTFESSVIRVRLDQTKANPLFLYYFFASPAGRAVMSFIVSGTNIKGIRASELKALKLPQPPPAEQRAIAEVLSDVDGLLEGLDRLITKKRDTKQATMQQLLTGNTRLPGFEKEHGNRPTELGDIPRDWGVRKIDSIIEDISMGPFGSDITVSNFVSSGVPVLSGANVASERVVDSFENFVTTAKARSLKKAVARRGDIVVTHRGTIGQISYIPEDSAFERYVVSQSQFRVRFSQNAVIPVWVVLYFHSKNGSKRLLEGKGHTGVPAIAQPTRTFRNLTIPIPSTAEQTAIAEVLTDIDAELGALEQRREKTRALKQAMMQELLTGRIRLVQPETAEVNA